MEWKKLVDSNVLRPHETEEYLDDIMSAFKYLRERDEAEEAVVSAKSAVLLARRAIVHPRRSDLSPEEPLQRLRAAQSTLNAASESLKSIKKLNNLVTNFLVRTGNYRTARHEAKRHSILLRWILQQVPLIELELNSSMAKDDSGAGHGGEGRGLKYGADEQRRDGVGRHSRSNRIAASRPQGGEARKRARSHDTVNDESPSKRLKYNTRSHNLVPQEMRNADIVKV